MIQKNDKGQMFALISDTQMRDWQPDNLKKRTKADLESCVCPICEMLREMHKKFKSKCLELRGKLARRAGVSEDSSDESSDESSDDESSDGAPLDPIKQAKKDFKEFESKMFPIIDEKEGTRSFVWPDMKDAVDAITCTPRSENGLYKMECAIEWCGECNNTFDFPRVLADESPEAETIEYQVYRSHSFCSVHNTIPGAAGECLQCFPPKPKSANKSDNAVSNDGEKDDENDGNKKQPAKETNKQRSRKRQKVSDATKTTTRNKQPTRTRGAKKQKQEAKRKKLSAPGKFRKKKELTKCNDKIGTFLKKEYIPMLIKYR